MNSVTVYPEYSLEEPEPGPPPAPGWAARLWMACLCPVWFVLDWFCSRDWRALLASLPALLFGGVAAGILVQGKTTPNVVWLRAYDLRAQAALDEKNTAAAEVYFRRIAMLRPSAPSAIFGLALAAAQQEDIERARALMRRIAPEDAVGYPPAHFWLAKDLLDQDGRLKPGAEKALENHLTQFLAGGGVNLEADALLGQIYTVRGDAERAIPYLAKASQRWPNLHLTLAILYERQKNTPAARASAATASDYFRKQVLADSQALEPRIQWAQSEALGKNYEQAVQILREGLKSADPERFRAALIEVYLWWYASIPGDDSASLAERLELLNAALTYGPNNPAVLTLLADLSTRDWSRAGEAFGALQEVLARGAAPPTVHAILGTQALLQGDYKTAEMHLEMAYQGNLQMPVVLNNLAWAMANRENADLERSLQLAQAAKKLSDHPEISDTVGHILARLGRQREAVVELETALRAFPNRLELHSTLAELYQALGDAGLAELHARLAKQKSP